MNRLVIATVILLTTLLGVRVAGSPLFRQQINPLLTQNSTVQPAATPQTRSTGVSSDIPATTAAQSLNAPNPGSSDTTPLPPAATTPAPAPANNNTAPRAIW